MLVNPQAGGVDHLQVALVSLRHSNRMPRQRRKRLPQVV